MNTDYYDILELTPDATQAQIKEQFRFLINAWHPDKFPNKKQKLQAEKRTKSLNEAYSILKDSGKRSRYDATRSRSQSEQSQSRSTNNQNTSRADQQRHQERQTHKKRQTYANGNRRKTQQQKQQAYQAEQQNHQKRRSYYEHERETKAEERWRKKVEKEGLTQSKKKASFLGNLFNKSRCMVGAHKGDWGFDKTDQCTQIRVCNLCDTVNSRTAHNWNEWQFRSYDVCHRVRVCNRCHEQDFDTHHQWQQWNYLSKKNCTQIKICGRCQEKSEQTRMAHIWGNWTYSDDSHVRVRSCQRCSERMSEPLETFQPSLASQTISLNGIWTAGDGLPVQFTQFGNQLSFKGVNQFGVVIVDGQGILNGMQAQLHFRYFDGAVYDEATVTMKISPDGRKMQGMVHYAHSGVSRMMGLVRQY